MEHEILIGEQLLDYVAERITLQDSLESVLRLLALHSLVNGGERIQHDSQGIDSSEVGGEC